MKSFDVEKLKKDWMPFFDRKKKVFLEKSIVNSARMTWLQDSFANSYFIFIVRNGYAVAEGIRRHISTFGGIVAAYKLKSNFASSYRIELCRGQ